MQQSPNCAAHAHWAPLREWQTQARGTGPGCCRSHMKTTMAHGYTATLFSCLFFCKFSAINGQVRSQKSAKDARERSVLLLPRWTEMSTMGGMARRERVDVWSACSGVVFANAGRNVQNDRSKVDGWIRVQLRSTCVITDAAARIRLYWGVWWPCLLP